MADERLVECQVCGYRWESSAKTPQCTDPNDTCGRSRRVEAVEPDEPHEPQDDGEAEPDEQPDEQPDEPDEQPDEQPAEPDESEESGEENSGDNEDDENDDEMVSPKEYDEFHSDRKSERATDDSDTNDESGDTGRALAFERDSDGPFGLDPQLVYGLCMAAAVLLALYLIHKRRSGSTGSTPAETETPPQQDPEPEPDPEPAPSEPTDETPAQREMREQVENTTQVPMFEN